MKRTLLVLLALAYPICGAPGCATLSAAENAGNALCKLAQDTRNGGAEKAACDTLQALEDWATVANLVAAKPDVIAAKEALVAHPALMAPCLDLKNPYTPEPPVPGE